MVYVPYPSGTMLIPSGATGSHLFIVVTEKCAGGSHLLFSVTSVRPNVSYDNACEFMGGEHEFITHHSYVYYRLAEQRRADSITKLVDNGYFTLKADLEGKHFKRICAGAKGSKFIKPWALRYFEENAPTV